MFNSNKEKSDLDKAIDAVHARMHRIGPDADEYAQQLEYLERLNKLKSETRRWKQPSWDTILQVTGSVVCVAFVVGYERGNVMTSKALNFIVKPSNMS